MRNNIPSIIQELRKSHSAVKAATESFEIAYFTLEQALYDKLSERRREVDFIISRSEEGQTKLESIIVSMEADVEQTEVASALANLPRPALI